MQLRGSSRPGSIISSHPLPTPLLEPEPLFLTNSPWNAARGAAECWWWALCLLAPPFHHNALKYTPNCTRWHTPSLLDCTLPGKLLRRSQAYSRARSQVHSPEARHSQSHLTICSHVCSWVLDPETCWVAGGRHREAGGGGRNHDVSRYHSLNLILARPPRQDLTMPHGHGVDNCSLRFCRKGRQLDLGESRSPTQIFQWNLLLASHQLWAYVYALGLMVMMAMVMMAMMMVSVIVIIVPEASRQVGWLRQR